MTLALATCASYPDLTRDDQHLVRALTARGIRCATPIWDDPQVRWEEHEAVVIRSCWDYHQRSHQFLAWLDRLEALGVRVVNPVPLLRWNLPKRYLQDLAARGIPVTPTTWLDRAAPDALAAILERERWAEVVIKPVISATAFGTWRAGPTVSAAEEARFAEQLAGADMMVQPYLRAIEATGELSCIFLAGEFSHAVRKRPRAGDFRVQSDFGGTFDAVSPNPAQIREATAVVAAAPVAPLYARVDACEVDGRLLLMELELIEPDLFLATDPQAPARMAAALGALL